jgi:hypothetical protein
MELTIMQASKKNVKSSRLQRIFGRSDSIFKVFWKAYEQLGMNGPRVSELFAVQKEAAKQKAQRILGTTESTRGIL